MKLFKNTNLYSRLALITSVTLVVGYFVVYAVYQNIDTVEVEPGATVTSGLMTKIKDNFDDLSGKISNFSFSTGNVGIWVSPNAKLQVNWNTYTNQVCNQTGWNCLDFSKKMPGSVYFKAYKSTTQSLATSTYATLLFDTEVADSSNSYNPSTWIFTIPVAGFYHFDGNIQFDNINAGQVSIKLYSPQQGSLCWEAQDAATATISDDRMWCSNSTYFNTWDTVYVIGFQNSGVAVNVSAAQNVNFSGFLVSQ